MKNYTKLSFALCAILSLSACVSTKYDDVEYRKKTVMNYVESKCSTGQYYLIVDNKNSKHQWKSQREFMCSDNATEKGLKSLDGKTYTKEALKEAAKNDEYIATVIMPN